MVFQERKDFKRKQEEKAKEKVLKAERKGKEKYIEQSKGIAFPMIVL